jgi:hypothetical protein
MWMNFEGLCLFHRGCRGGKKAGRGVIGRRLQSYRLLAHPPARWDSLAPFSSRQ